MTHGCGAGQLYGVNPIYNQKETEPSSVRNALPGEIAELAPKPSAEEVVAMSRKLAAIHWVTLFEEISKQEKI